MAVSEPNNYVEHFIDSSGVVSWRFFSAKSDIEFVEWDFASPTNDEEADTLFGILKELDKEAYIMVHEDLGAPVCRILVPGYSEVYPVEDLVWDNTNIALQYREDILNLHRLSDEQLEDLVERLEDSQLDNYMDIITLIGIEFDENTEWGQLTILELKLLIYLALQRHEDAQEYVEMFLQYNDNTPECVLFYRAIEALLEITLDDELELDDYRYNLGRMYGENVIEAVIGSVQGTTRFYGLTPTNMQLEGIDRHLKLLDSYKKLHRARAKSAS